MRYVLCIFGLVLVACGKSNGSGEMTALSHDIVGNWAIVFSERAVAFNSNRTMTESRTFSADNCTLTATYTFDVADSTLTAMLTGFTKSNDAACESLCTSRTGQACTVAKDSLLHWPARSSSQFGISGNSLAVDGLLTFTRQ